MNRFYLKSQKISHCLACILRAGCLIANFCNMGLFTLDLLRLAVNQVTSNTLSRNRLTHSFHHPNPRCAGNQYKSLFMLLLQCLLSQCWPWSEKTADHEAALGVHFCRFRSGSELRCTSVSIYFYPENCI